jgi:putative DNA methylase
MDHPVISPKKLIEVALPLDAINVASAREKSIRHGHPSTLHLWWARRPLAAARAVIFSQLVNDPEDVWRCQNPGEEPNKQTRGHWTKARARLFKIIEDLVLWENTTNEEVLEKAREEIRKSWREVCELNKEHPQAAELFNPDKMPGLHDPFAGGGAIPIEAQRLGLDACASDLNPVAVIINKAMIEIPPKFSGRRPVNPKANGEKCLIAREWKCAQGLAEDVRYYGQWIWDEAFKRIGHLYPQIEVTPAMVTERSDLAPYEGKKLTVIAWLWARTIKSSNPAFSHVDVPLASTFILSSKAGNEAYVEPVIENGGYRFGVKIGRPTDAEGAKSGTKLGRGSNFRCLMSGSAIAGEYIMAEIHAGRMGARLMAVVAEGERGRMYLSPTPEHEAAGRNATPRWQPEGDTPSQLTGGGAQANRYGLKTWASLFMKRQLVALTTFSDLISEARERIVRDSIAAGIPENEQPLASNGRGTRAYAEAVSVYLACSLSKAANMWSSLCFWMNDRGAMRETYARQMLPMIWDPAEANPFSNSGGNYSHFINKGSMALDFASAKRDATAINVDAQTQRLTLGSFVSTDPPYYDNIPYADLSDFFYVWLRSSLKTVYPDLFATIAVPKAEELVATAYRHGTKQKAEMFFLDGMTKALRNLSEQVHPSAPITIYYAFKQSETKTDGTNSTGWETFLEAVYQAGLTLTGTWPMRTEQSAALKSKVNALASSIILVCRPRASDAGTISRRQLIRELNTTLPLALDAMTRESEGLHSPVAPVDLSQAIIGPGMAVFSKYASVLEADGTPMSVRTALQLINRFLAEDDFDADTQFCLHWFEQYGWETGKFGEADTLARAKGTSVDGVKQAGVLNAAGGNVRLLKWAEYPSDWDPQADQRLPIWEVLHQLIRVFKTDGETGAAAVFTAVQSKAEAARQLAYRLYTLCERKNWAEDARAYNEVVTSWSGIESAAAKEPAMKQGELF